MAGSTRTFQYTLRPGDGDLTRVEIRARKILDWACAGDKRITHHDVSGTPLGVVVLSMTIHGRDRWWATQLAQDILDYMLWGLRTELPGLELQSDRLEPHMHRGYAHGRVKRHRGERQNQDSTNHQEP